MYSPFIILVVLLAALDGVVFIQIKAHLFWRLTSLALVLAFCSWVSFVFGGAKGSVMLKEYEQGSRAVVELVDQLATKGRTNDVHQVCQKYLGFSMLRVSDITNLDLVVEDARSRVSQQPSTLTKP